MPVFMGGQNMWIKGNYRRNLMDMHIDDWNPEFLSKINVKEYVEALKDAGVQAAMVKGKPHTGLCYYPSAVTSLQDGCSSYAQLSKICVKYAITAIPFS